MFWLGHEKSPMSLWHRALESSLDQGPSVTSAKDVRAADSPI